MLGVWARHTEEIKEQRSWMYRSKMVPDEENNCQGRAPMVGTCLGI